MVDISEIKALLIDDNPADIRLVQEYIKDTKWNSIVLLVASSLEEGLKLLFAGGIDVVLLDLGLPGTTGLETFEKYLQGCSNNVPTIILTGLDDENVAVEAARSGAEDYLVKGQINGHTLAKSLRYAFERCSRRQLVAGVEQTREELMTLSKSRLGNAQSTICEIIENLGIMVEGMAK